MCSFVQPSSDDGNISTNCKETEKTAHDKRLDTNVEVKSHSVVQSNSVSRPEGVQHSSRLLHVSKHIVCVLSYFVMRIPQFSELLDILFFIRFVPKVPKHYSKLE